MVYDKEILVYLPLLILIRTFRKLYTHLIAMGTPALNNWKYSKRGHGRRCYAIEKMDKGRTQI